MALTELEIDAVKETGICHEVALQWQKFMDGTGVDVAVPKAKALCSICLTEFVKSIEVINLDEV